MGLFKLLRKLLIGDETAASSKRERINQAVNTKQKDVPAGSTARIDEKTAASIEEKINKVFESGLTSERSGPNGKEQVFRSGELELVLSAGQGKVVYNQEIVATFTAEKQGYAFHPARNVNEQELFQGVDKSFHHNKEFENEYSGRSAYIEAKEKAIEELERKKGMSRVPEGQEHLYESGEADLFK